MVMGGEFVKGIFDVVKCEWEERGEWKREEKVMMSW